ncbi:MAG: metallophosphoesterase family protein [Deltaproteobacteria bacterium]|nr:metallophosphoesterase family protein [Deltaproteobacteria bacterium]
MKIAVLSDIHGNGEALDAVARELERTGPDRVVHLGDLAGYNAEPEKCVRWAMERTSGGVLGNHDAVACGKAGGESFNTPALIAARWSAAHLSDGSREYLGALHDRLVLDGGILMVHGAPSDPDRYLFTLDDAVDELDRLSGDVFPTIVLFGHTHVPAAVIRRHDGSTEVASQGGLRLREGERVLLNPGSVGQPRDRDPRASFLLFDTVSLSVAWIRVPYDVPSCRRKILAAGLPRLFADRLTEGM